MKEMRITITLLDEEVEALRELAKVERRETHNQAAFVIRQGLHQMGLLKGDLSPTHRIAQPVNLDISN